MESKCERPVTIAGARALSFHDTSVDASPHLVEGPHIPFWKRPWFESSRMMYIYFPADCRNCFKHDQSLNHHVYSTSLFLRARNQGVENNGI